MKLTKPYKKEIDEANLSELRFVEVSSVTHSRTAKRYIPDGKGAFETFEKVIVTGTEYKKMGYDELVVSLIRNRYSQDDENAIIRKKLAGLNDEEFAEYNAYAEDCKAQAKAHIALLNSKFDSSGRFIEPEPEPEPEPETVSE